MSTSTRSASGGPALTPARRVREEARERLVLMAFSAAVSLAAALALVVLTRLGN